MRIELTAVSKGRLGQALPTVSLRFSSGEARLAVAETEQRPTVLGLIASGRMRPDAGTVTIDDASDAGTLRRRVALVDAPDVSDPAPNVTVAGVTAEELMFAGRRSHPVAVRRWLIEAGMRELAGVPLADVPASDRLRLLLELTALRRGVDGVVLVSPDRHGGDPELWWALAEEFAGRGLAVLVIAGEASATVLAGRAGRAEASDAPDPSTAPDGALDRDPQRARDADAAPADPQEAPVEGDEASGDAAPLTAERAPEADAPAGDPQDAPVEGDEASEVPAHRAQDADAAPGDPQEAPGDPQEAPAEPGGEPTPVETPDPEEQR